MKTKTISPNGVVEIATATLRAPRYHAAIPGSPVTLCGDLMPTTTRRQRDEDRFGRLPASYRPCGDCQHAINIAQEA